MQSGKLDRKEMEESVDRILAAKAKLAAVPAALVALNLGVAELVAVGRLPFDAPRFVLALALSWLLMALMIVVGVCYPARRAMQVQPAEALHDE